jgi:UDP-N-acetylmuramoyl-tripeptide--D-alanyl-D-alanine ligase
LPSSGLITNIGHTHLETMKTKEDILDAKAELLKSLSGEGVAFINLDDPLVKTLKDSLTCKVVTYSFLDETADFFAKIVEECGIAGQRIQCRFKTDTVDFLFPLSGQHNATNALAAFCVATHYKVSAKDLKSSFESFKPSAGRSETVRINAEITVLNDSYNANPDSMIAALKMLKNSAKTQPTYAVLGDMLELGEDDIKYHRQVGDIIKQLSVDYVLTYGGLSAYYGKIAAENKRINVFSTDNQKELIEQLKQWLKARPGLVLIKGSRGMKMELVLHALQKAFG